MDIAVIKGLKMISAGLRGIEPESGDFLRPAKLHTDKPKRDIYPTEINTVGDRSEHGVLILSYRK
jgi:hypothetical protein